MNEPLDSNQCLDFIVLCIIIGSESSHSYSCTYCALSRMSCPLSEDSSLENCIELQFSEDCLSLYTSALILHLHSFLTILSLFNCIFLSVISFSWTRFAILVTCFRAWVLLLKKNPKQIKSCEVFFELGRIKEFSENIYRNCTVQSYKR